MFIEIYYDNSDEAMYGNDPNALEEVDYASSEAAFERKLDVALRTAYPAAEIIIRPGANVYRVDGKTASADAIDVGEIVYRAWQAFDWVQTS